MHTTNANLTVRVLAALSIALFAATSAYAEPPEFSVIPNRVDISGTFRGARLRIEAAIPKDAQAVVEISGTVREIHLLKKGRRGGLWMSVGEVKVKGAPMVYLVMTTNADASSAQGTTPTWGYEAIRKNVQFTGTVDSSQTESLFKEFVNLKESGGLYGIFPGSLKVGSQTGDLSHVEGNIGLPGNIAPGTYSVKLSVISNGKTVSQRTEELTVHMRGLPALLDDLAHQHALLYGILSVAIALVTGLVMGYVFKGKSAH